MLVTTQEKKGTEVTKNLRNGVGLPFPARGVTRKGSPYMEFNANVNGSQKVGVLLCEFGVFLHKREQLNGCCLCPVQGTCFVPALPESD